VNTAPAIVAIVGPTAAGKSALGLALAEAFGGEILSCDSTAVYRGIDIGTDKVSEAERRGIPHHLIDLVGPEATYSAATFARAAAEMAREVTARGHLPLLVGGTGFYYRALMRGLFDGPGRHDVLRARLDRIADRRGSAFLHRWLAKVDAPSAARLAPADRKRLVRALEVYLLTGRPLSHHFGATRSPIGDFDRLTIGLRMTRDALLPRVTRRVDAQFARGVVDEVRALLAAGLPRHTHALSGLVYRQIVEYLDGVRDLPDTRALIIQENLRYARRQMTWFRGEADVQWIEGPGESRSAIDRAVSLVGEWLTVRLAAPPESPSPGIDEVHAGS
jgi:tRNA dimethylallyltransferase